MSALSPVSTVPPGSASGPTRASTAEPVRARRLSSAARRATAGVTSGWMMQVLRKRFALASRWIAVERLDEDHRRDDRRPEALVDEGSDERDGAGLVRDDSRVTPPLSRTSMSARLAEAPLANAPSDGVRMRALAGRGLADLRGEFREIGRRLVERVPDARAPHEGRSAGAQMPGGRVASAHRVDRRAGTPGGAAYA